MKNIKEHIEKQVNKHGKLTVYSPESVALDISKKPYICRDDGETTSFEFGMDCEELTDYCNVMGITITNNH